LEEINIFYINNHLLTCDLTPKSQSLWEVIFNTKKTPNIYLHGSIYAHILRNSINAFLDLNKVLQRTSYKKFKAFNKHMSKIGDLKCTNPKEDVHA
jgi:hypothetical protein